jgi:two-component system alkaline phosphatase synthesis response regulator PhoP
MPKMLIVEGDPAARDVVSHTLSREGMETIAVEDGKEALKGLRSDGEEPFDFVVLDLMLPGMDGASVKRFAKPGRKRQ